MWVEARIAIIRTWNKRELRMEPARALFSFLLNSHKYPSISTPAQEPEFLCHDIGIG
jgi:hypothetical protein